MCSWSCHDDVIKWKHFPRYWPFVRGIHRSPVNSPHKGQWRGALMFSLICAWINGWVNNRKAGDLGRYRAHDDVTEMLRIYRIEFVAFCNMDYKSTSWFKATLISTSQGKKCNPMKTLITILLWVHCIHCNSSIQSCKYRTRFSSFPSLAIIHVHGSYALYGSWNVFRVVFVILIISIFTKGRDLLSDPYYSSPLAGIRVIA